MMASCLMNLLLIAVVTRGAASFTCPQVTVQTLIVDPEDCRHYYHCLPDGRVFAMRCPDGLVFDPRQKVCFWDSTARSCAPDHEEKPLESQQQTRNSATKPKTNQPTKERRNPNNSRPSQNKPPTKPNLNPRNEQPKTVSNRQSRNNFNARSRRKNVGSAPISGKVTNMYAPTVAMMTKAKPTPARPPVAINNDFMHQVNTGESALGSTGRVDEKNGPQQSGTELGFSGIYARPPQRHKRSPEDNLISDSVYCPTGYAYIPDPFSCTAFYHCYNWQPMRKQCPPGLYFDMQTRVCNWPHNVNCLDGDRGKAVRKFEEMRNTYKNSPRGLMSMKSSRSSKKTTTSRRTVSSKVATTASTRSTPETSKATSPVKSTTTTGQVSTSKPVFARSEPLKRTDKSIFKQSKLLPKSRAGLDAGQKLLSPTSSSSHPTFSSSTRSSSISQTLSTLPQIVHYMPPRVPHTLYQSVDKTKNLKTDQKLFNQKLTTTKKAVAEEVTQYSSKSNEVTTRPVVPSSSPGENSNSMLSRSTTPNTPLSHDPRGSSTISIKGKSSRPELTTTYATEPSTLRGSRKDTSTHDNNPALSTTKMPSEFQDAVRKGVTRKNVPIMAENSKETNGNPTQKTSRHDQTQESTTAVNSHTSSSSSPPQNKAETTPTEQNTTASVLLSSSTDVPIDAFKSVLDTASPMAKSRWRLSERSALVKKNQTTPKTLAMTRMPMSTVRNLRVQPITWMNKRRVPTPYKSGNKLKGQSYYNTRNPTTNNSLSQSFIPASLSYTPSTLLFRKLVMPNYSNAPVQIEKFMASFLRDIKQDQRSENGTSRNETKAQSLDTQANKTENLESGELEKEKNLTSLPGSVDKAATGVQNNTDINASGKITDEKTSPISILTKATNETLFQTQKTTSTDPSVNMSSSKQPGDDGLGNNVTVKIDTYNVKLPNVSRKGENASSQISQLPKDSKTYNEADSSGQENAVFNELDNSSQAESDQHLDEAQNISVQANQEHPKHGNHSEADSSSNPTALTEKPSAQKENVQPTFASESVVRNNTEEEMTENENKTEILELSTATLQYLATLKSTNESSGKPLQKLSDDIKSTHVPKAATGETIQINQQTLNCTSTGGCSSNHTEGNSTKVLQNSSQSSAEKKTSKTFTTAATTSEEKTSKAADPIIKPASKTETESSSSMIKERHMTRDNVSFSKETAETLQNITEGGAVQPPSNMTVEENAEKVQSSLFLGLAHLPKPLDSSQTDVDKNSSLHEDEDPEQKSQNKTEPADLASDQGNNNSTDQSSYRGQTASTADIGMNATASTISAPKTDGQSNNLTNPAVSGIDLNATTVANKTQSFSDPEVIKEKKTELATSKPKNETSNTVTSTLVISVKLEKKDNQTVLKANNISTFSSIIKDTPLVNETGNSSTLNPSVLTTQRNQSANTTDPNDFSLNSTMISLGNNNSVASTKESKQVQVSHNKQETKLVNDYVVHDVDKNESTQDSTMNASISAGLDTSTLHTKPAQKTSNENSAESIIDLTDIAIIVSTDSTNNSFKTTPAADSSDSQNETSAAANNGTITVTNSTESSGNMSETLAVNASSSESSTAINPDVTTLPLDSTDARDQRPDQQRGISRADSEKVSNIVGQDDGKNTHQSPTVKDPTHTSNVKTITDKTTVVVHTTFDENRDSRSETLEEIKQKVSYDITTAEDKSGSKRFVSLKDLITWYLKHWKNYSQWQRGQ